MLPTEKKAIPTASAVEGGPGPALVSPPEKNQERTAEPENILPAPDTAPPEPARASAPEAEAPPDVPTLGERPASTRDFWVTVGAGAGFTSYRQTVPGFSEVRFGRITSPSIAAQSGFFVSDRVGLDLGYSDIPGEAKTSPTISVQNGAYRWRSLSAALLYRLPLSAAEEGGKEDEWAFRVGARQQQTPFVVPLAANSVALHENSLTALSAGVELRSVARKNVRIEAALNYQRPVGGSSDAGSDFSLTPGLAVDGSLGASYEIRPSLRLGPRWDFQYQAYKFSYKNGGTAFTGSQSLFSTSFNLRLGVEF